MPDDPSADAPDEPSSTVQLRSVLPAEPPPCRFLQTFGPGLITGTSDDDPSGLAADSQVGFAGGAAYAIGEGLHWRTGLDRRPNEATGFYAVLAVATLLGLGLTFTSIDPIRALFWSAVINGVVAVPVMIVLMCMASNARVMGNFMIKGLLLALGWAATAVMALAALELLATWGQ